MSPPLIALLAGPAILVPLAWYALARPQVRGARWYGLVLLTIAFWSATYLWELSADNLDSKVFALKVKYLAVVLLPSGWIGFILSFVGSPPGRVWRRVIPVAIISAIFLTIAWTNDWHGWFWGRLTIEQIGPYRVIHGRAAFFWVNVIYTYVVLAAGLVLLVSHAVHSPYLYKQRARTLIAGTLVPWIGNLAFVLSTEETIIDPTPFLFTCTGVIAAVAVFRYELFEPVPTLRDARIESIGDGIIILDRRWRVADLNPAAEAVLRCTRAEAAGSAIDRLLPGWPVAAGTTAAADVTVGEGPLARVYDVRSSDVRSRAGETTGKVVVLRDVTERRHAELALRESEARYRAVIEEREQLLVRAEEANRLKDEFLATLSHELRTPLTAVLGWTRMLVRAEVQPERVAHALGVIERNAVAQARLVDDLLDISRITGGRLRLKMAKADVSALVREALDAIGPSADAKRITIDVRLINPVPLITVDPERLQQVIWNLLTNAIKFTPEAGTVTVSVAPASAGVELTVSDTGRGIAPAFMPFVFDPFRQAESGSNRSVPGLGLGLAIVQRIVEAHGGRVEAVSDGPGRGATFRVYLPVVSSGVKFTGPERRTVADGSRSR